MVETKEAIESQISELRRRKVEMEAAEFKETILPRLRDMLGKTLVYRNNSYSCPEKPSDYWDVFRRVVRVVGTDFGAWLICEECSIDRDCKPSISIEAQYCRSAEQTLGWIACTAKEYEQMRVKVMAAISAPDDYAEKLAPHD